MKLSFIFLVFFQTAFASILPENNLAIPPSDKSDGLSEIQYHQVIDKVESVYGPIINKMGKKLVMKRLWEDPRVNAGTIRKENEIIINLYGGYARHPSVTEDGYALVICHEIGHHLGGTPRKYFEGERPSWPSTEGQADYFATLKCLRKVFRKDDNVAIAESQEASSTISQKCSVFPTRWERALCKRTSIAGLAIGAISADIRNDTVPQIDTPDLSEVKETFEAHPNPQCRLDTYFQGSICEVSSSVSVSSKDETVGTCHALKNHTDGLRPTCWFKPIE